MDCSCGAYICSCLFSLLFACFTDVEPECIVDFLDVERRVFVPVDRFDEAHAFIVKAIVQEDGREMSLQITDEDNQVLDSSQIADTLRFLCETSKITKAAPTVRLKGWWFVDCILQC